jgi:hypothetical protein
MTASVRGAQTMPVPGRKYVMSEASPSYTWQYVFALLRKEPPDGVIKVASSDIASQTAVGMQRLDTVAEEPRPQFRCHLDDNSACLVTDCGDWYEAHLDYPAAVQSAQPSSGTVTVRGATDVLAREGGGWSCLAAGSCRHYEMATASAGQAPLGRLVGPSS